MEVASDIGLPVSMTLTKLMVSGREATAKGVEGRRFAAPKKSAARIRIHSITGNDFLTYVYLWMA